MKLRSPFARIGKFVRISAVCSVGAVCVALALSSNASANTIIPGGVSGVEGYAGANADNIGSPTEPEQVMNGAAITVGNPLNSSTWAADNTWQHGWQQAVGTAGNVNWIGADLGSVHSDLQGIVVWNTREVTDRGSKSVNVYYASTPTTSLSSLNGTGYTFPGSDGWTLLGNYTIPQAPPTGPGNAGNGSGPDMFISIAGITARDYAFQIESNWGSNIRQGFAGLQFATPEPSSIVLIGLGALGLGAVARRRRKKA